MFDLARKGVISLIYMVFFRFGCSIYKQISAVIKISATTQDQYKTQNIIPETPNNTTEKNYILKNSHTHKVTIDAPSPLPRPGVRRGYHAITSTN